MLSPTRLLPSADRVRVCVCVCVCVGRALSALSHFSLLPLLLLHAGPAPVSPALSARSVWAACLVLRWFSHFQAAVPVALCGRHNMAFQRCAHPSS